MGDETMDIKPTNAARAFLRATLGEFARQSLVISTAMDAGWLTAALLQRLDMDWLIWRAKLEAYVSGSNPNDSARTAILSGRVARRMTALAEQLKVMHE